MAQPLPTEVKLVTPAGRMTATGVLLSVVVPFPSAPKRFLPQHAKLLIPTEQFSTVSRVQVQLWAAALVVTAEAVPEAQRAALVLGAA
jgi:hypothetical protein